MPGAPKPGEGGSAQNSSDGTEPAPPSDNSEVIAIEQLADKLLEREPASLPHRTLLALARLKQGRANDALRVYENVQVAPSALTGSALAVHAAVLEATGRHDDAEIEKEKIDINAVLPEEAALIQNVKN